jgi:hypothetical protein
MKTGRQASLGFFVFVAIAAVTIAGYSVGKDMALRDNARDRAVAQAGAD